MSEESKNRESPRREDAIRPAADTNPNPARTPAPTLKLHDARIAPWGQPVVRKGFMTDQETELLQLASDARSLLQNDRGKQAVIYLTNVETLMLEVQDYREDGNPAPVTPSWNICWFDRLETAGATYDMAPLTNDDVLLQALKEAKKTRLWFYAEQEKIFGPSARPHNPVATELGGRRPPVLAKLLSAR